MFYDAREGHGGLPYNPLKAIVGPRPVGWISAQDGQGRLNLSPYSFFNAVAEAPFMVMFSSTGVKDAVAAISETREFVCNLATWELREAMNATSAPLARGESEFAHAELTPAPSILVAPPRVAEAPAALECKLLSITQLTTLSGEAIDQHMVVGQVVGVHIADHFLVDGKVDTAAMRPILRGGYMDYFVATPETRFVLRRPKGT